MYYRQFITLTGAGQGRVVLEGRADIAKAALYLQNVKAGSYRLILLSGKEGETLGLDIGSVPICEKGSYEGKFAFEREGAVALDKVDAAALISLNKAGDYQNFSAALTGFVGIEYAWRTKLAFPQLVSKPIIMTDATQKAEKASTTTTAPVVSIVEAVPEPVYNINSFQNHHPAPKS